MKDLIKNGYTNTLARRLSELENKVWLPPDGHERRSEAYEEIKKEILAELSLNPEDLILKALLADASEWLDETEAAQTLAQSIVSSADAPAAAQAIALCVLAACEDTAHYKKTEHCYSPIATLYYRQALETDPDNQQAAVMLADRLFDGCGKPQEARAIINKALQTHPQSRKVLQTAIYIKKLGGGPFEEIIDHLSTLAEIKPLGAGECSDFAVAFAKLGNYHAALEWCLKGQETEDTTDADSPNRHQRQRPGIKDPCLKTITASGIDQLNNDPDNLEAQCMVALCFWYMPAIGASLVADILLQQLDSTAPGRLGLIAEKVTREFNAQLKTNTLEFYPVKNPWPPGEPVSAFGRLFKVIDTRATWGPGDLN